MSLAAHSGLRSPAGLTAMTTVTPARVVHVALQLDTGGMEKLLIEFARHADRARTDIVCVSRDAESRARADGFPENRIRTIWNGIDLDRFAYAGPTPRGPIVMVGRLHHVKDIPTLLHATALAVAQEPGVRLDIAGEGPCR